MLSSLDENWEVTLIPGEEGRGPTLHRLIKDGCNTVLISFLDLHHLIVLTYVVCHSAKLEYCMSMVGLVPELLSIGEYNLTVVLMNCIYYTCKPYTTASYSLTYFIYCLYSFPYEWTIRSDH